MAAEEATMRLHRVLNSQVVDALQVLHNEVKCIICCDYFQNPYQCLNGHTYCKCCIEHAMKVQSVCPECRVPIGRRDIKPNRKIGAISEGAHPILLDTFLEDVRWLVKQVGECPKSRLNTVAAALTATGASASPSASPSTPTKKPSSPPAKRRSAKGQRTSRTRMSAAKSAESDEDDDEDDEEDEDQPAKSLSPGRGLGQAKQGVRPDKRDSGKISSTSTPAKSSAAADARGTEGSSAKRGKQALSSRSKDHSVPALDLKGTGLRGLARGGSASSAPKTLLSTAGLIPTQHSSPRQSISSTGSPISSGDNLAASASVRVVVIGSTQLSSRGVRALEQLQSLAPSMGIEIQHPLCLFDMRHTGSHTSRSGSPLGSPSAAGITRPDPLPVPRLTHVVVGPSGLGASQRRMPSSPATHPASSSSSSSAAAASSSSSSSSSSSAAAGVGVGSSGTSEVGLWATRRTPKYLCGLAQGAWIVSEEWLFDCLRVKALIHERPFELMGDAKAARAPRANRERVRQAVTRSREPALFPDCIIVPPPVTRKAEKHVFFLARAAGCAQVAQVHELPVALVRAASEKLKLRIIVPGSAGGDAAYAQAAVIAAKAMGVEDADVVGTHWLYESLSASKQLPTLAFSELSHSPDAQWLRSTPDASDGKACGSVDGKHVGHAQWFLETQLRLARDRIQEDLASWRALQDRGDSSPISPGSVAARPPCLDWENALNSALPTAVTRMKAAIRRRTKEASAVVYTW